MAGCLALYLRSILVAESPDWMVGLLDVHMFKILAASNYPHFPASNMESPSRDRSISSTLGDAVESQKRHARAVTLLSRILARKDAMLSVPGRMAEAPVVTVRRSELPPDAVDCK